MSLAALLAEHPLADEEALLHTGTRSVTVAGARAAAAELAEALRGAGVEAGQAVAVRLPNGPEAVEAMFAVWQVGAVLVPVNPRAADREVERVVGALGPRAIVDVDGVRPLAVEPHRYDDGVAFVLWTSGTTGEPKPVLHTHDAYLALVDRVLEPLRAGGRDPGRRPTPNLIPVSLALNAGIYNVLFGLRAGAAIVIMDRFDTREFADLVARFGIRSTVLPPTALTMLNDDEGLDDLSPLRYVRSITAPLSPLQARRFTDRFGAFVLNSYGQAEIGEVIGWTAADAREHPEKLGALGRPHRGVEVRVDGDGTGELLVRVADRAVGYAGAGAGASLADRLDADGFLRTGDVGRVDEDGFVWLEGRVGDVINRGGNKVHPTEVEEVLRLSPAVVDAAVVGVPDERLGEVPVAAVVERQPVPDDELRALCREHLVPYKVPVRFCRLPELPRNEIGKVRRAEVATTVAAGCGGPGGA